MILPLDLANYETTTFSKSSFNQNLDIGKSALLKDYSALNLFVITHPTGGCIWYIIFLPMEFANFDISIDNFADGLACCDTAAGFVITTFPKSSSIIYIYIK